MTEATKARNFSKQYHPFTVSPAWGLPWFAVGIEPTVCVYRPMHYVFKTENPILNKWPVTTSFETLPVLEWRPLWRGRDFGVHAKNPCQTGDVQESMSCDSLICNELISSEFLRWLWSFWVDYAFSVKWTAGLHRQGCWSRRSEDAQPASTRRKSLDLLDQNAKQSLLQLTLHTSSAKLLYFTSQFVVTA